MKVLKNLAITGSLSLIAFAGLSSAATIGYDQTLGGYGFYNGSGNSPDHFTTLTDGNLELALSAVNRYTGSPTLVPNGSNYDYNDNQNTDPTKQWGFYFSIDANADGSNSHTIGDYTYTLDIFDNTTGTDSAAGVFNPLSLPDSASYNGSGVTSGNTNGSNYTGTSFYNSDYGIQNAEWPGYSFLFGSGWNPNDMYTVTLNATPVTGGQTDSLAITVNGTPEPGTIVTMLGSLGALGLFIRRRKA